MFLSIFIFPAIPYIHPFRGEHEPLVFFVIGDLHPFGQFRPCPLPVPVERGGQHGSPAVGEGDAVRMPFAVHSDRG